MQQLSKQQIVSVVAGVAAVVVLAVGGFFAVKAMNKPKPMTITNTKCFSISTPANYKVTIDANKCQFSAYSGVDRKHFDNFILIFPIQPNMNTAKDADAALLVASPKATRFLPTTVGHKPAEAIEGVTQSGSKQEKHVETYVIYNLNTYTMPDGSTNAFRATFAYQPSSQADTIAAVKSIVWK